MVKVKVAERTTTEWVSLIVFVPKKKRRMPQILRQPSSFERCQKERQLSDPQNGRFNCLVAQGTSVLNSSCKFWLLADHGGRQGHRQDRLCSTPLTVPIFKTFLLD